MEATVPAEKLFSLTEKLKSDKRTALNYLIDLTAVDFTTHFTVVYHLESTDFRHILVLKSKISDRESPAVDLTALYPTAEYFEREVLTCSESGLITIQTWKRFFLEESYGYPLREDFRDEVNYH